MIAGLLLTHALSNPPSLQVRIDEIEHTPREHHVMPLLVDMAVYVGDWHEGCKSMVRSQLVQIPLKWAADIDDQLEKGAAKQLEGKAVTSLKAKQCMYFMYGVLCFGGSAVLSNKDTATLCQLHLLANSCRAFTADAEAEAECAALHIKCLNVVAGRVHSVVAQAQIDPGFITAAVRLVLDHTPTQLQWARLTGTTACFEVEHEGHLFSVNVLTGVVLYDGAPPSFLPENMRKNEDYRRLFGNANFEVTMASDGVFKTTRAISGRFYEFSRSVSNGEVVIEELDAYNGERLLLLRLDGAWGKDFPVRLRNMHSHWLCRDQNVIVMRPKDFRKRDAAFIVRCSDSDGPASCYRVPAHLSSNSCKTLLKEVKSLEYNLHTGAKLVLLAKGSNLMSILGKFEPRATGPNAVIHTYLKPGGGLTIELPRFELNFDVENPLAQQKDGHARGISCLSHRGYHLACAQQLQDTLPGLVRYLVIEREDGDTKVLVPRGNVALREDATSRVRIECEDEEDEGAELKVFCYTVHRRWNQLDAGGVSARLQLAAMYAATDTLLPDPRAGMTGSEKAVELVRRCFVNHPLQEGDNNQLLRVLDLSGHNPALALVCGDLLKSSMGLSFLHNANSRPRLHQEAVATLEHAASAYEGECATLPWHQRRRLTGAEDARVLSGRAPTPMELHQCFLQHGSIQLPGFFLISAGDVQAAEEKLWKTTTLVLSTIDQSKGWAAKADDAVDPYPLRVPHDADTLTEDMHAELRTSWEAHQLNVPDPSDLTQPLLDKLHDMFGAQHSEVSSMRGGLSNDLLKALITFGAGGHAVAHHMHRVAGLLPTACLSDLPSLLWENERVLQFNPFLARSAASRLTEAVVTWLRLCVLEDKLGRLRRWTRASETEALMWQELQVMLS